jgi:RNA polymerase sigma-70 factor, ECF subfamily
VRSLGRPAVKLAFMMVQDKNVAEEIVQEAFARLWASSRTPAAESDFRRYLYRTVANLAHDHHRKLGRLSALPIPSRSPVDPLDEIERRSGGETLKTALLALPLRERQALYLRFFEDQSIAETARMMGAPQVTVRVLVHRGLGKLRRILASDLSADRVAT